MSDHFSSLFIKGLKRLWSFEKGLEVLLSGFNPLISNSTKWSNTLDNSCNSQFTLNDSHSTIHTQRLALKGLKSIFCHISDNV